MLESNSVKQKSLSLELAVVPLGVVNWKKDQILNLLQKEYASF